MQTTMQTKAPRPSYPPIKAGDVVKYAHPTEGEEDYRFTVTELRGDRVLITLVDDTFTISPSECVPLAEITLALTLTLSHCPRFETGGYGAGEPNAPRRELFPVGTLAEASRKLCAWRTEHRLGASNFGRGCGEVSDGGKLVAVVSYNGRVWTPEGQEVTA